MNRYRDWLEQAERDLGRAELDIYFDYWEWACFTAQQAAGKAVKALLVQRGLSAWGRSITPMLRCLEGTDVPEALVGPAQLLDAYYILARYPDGFAEGKPADYFNKQKAEEAVDAARSILRFSHDHLPPAG